MMLMQAYRSIKGRARRAIIGDPVLWDRIILDQETRKIIDALPAPKMDALEISGDNGKAYPFRSFKSANFPEYDICKEPIDLEAFDIVLAEQVFEHLLYPYRAARNVYAMLQPGGYFFISTPFLQKIHNFPVDCSRWTALGMKYFLADAGFPLETIQTGSWGNRSVIRATFKTPYFPYYNRFIHSLKNEETFPIQVWALARKAPISALNQS
jgi:SAM-dependent methyltransferase